MKNTPLIIVFFLLIVCSQAWSQEWKRYMDSATLFAGQKNNPRALEYYLKANGLLKQDSALTITYFLNNTLTGDLYITIGQYVKAEPFYVAAKQTIEKLQGKVNADYASSCNNLGWVYRLTGQYEKSELLLIEAKNIREKIFGKENADYATSCNRLAVLYADAGQYEDAGPLYREAKDIRERVLGKDHLDYAMSCNNLAIFSVLTGKLHEAEPLYLEAKQIREKAIGKENPLYAASCNNLAALYLDLGQYGKAEPLYLEAKLIREKTLGKEHPDYAASCDNLAILYLDIGEYRKAEPLYIEARQIREKILGKRHPDYARGSNNLALFYRKLRQYEKAEPLLIEAREIFGSVLGKAHALYAASCNNLGALYMDMGDYVKAATFYDEAKTIWASVLGKEHPEYAKSCNNLALIYRQLGQFEKAEPLFTEARRIREKLLGRDHPDYAQSCDNLAVLYTDIGQWSKAAPLHEEAKEIRAKVLGNEHPDYVESCINLANLYWNLNDFNKANDFYTTAFNSQQAQTKKIFQFTTEPEKQSYLQRVNEFRSYFLSYSSSGVTGPESAYAYAVSLANRNLVLTSSRQLRQSIYNTDDSSLVNKYNQWRNAREQLAFWYTKPVNQRTEQFGKTETKANALEKELVNISDKFRKQHQEISWQDIHQALKPGEAAIEFSAFQYYNGRRWTDSIRYIAIILRKDKPFPELVNLFEKRELDSLLDYRNTSPGQHKLSFLYTAKKSDAPGSHGKSLFNLVWQPLEQKMEGVRTIYFSPAGELYKVAFAALPVSITQVLSDRYRLVQLNTTAALVEKQLPAINEPDKIILYGGVQYDVDSANMRQAVSAYGQDDGGTRSLPDTFSRYGVPEFNFLQGSEKEVNGISKLAEQMNYHVTIAEGQHATEESFKILSGKNSPAAIHIATHGFFFPDPKNNKIVDRVAGGIGFRQSDNPLIRSGLALSGANNAWKGKPVAGVEDGILTAYEVSNMDLPNTKLAVLSACETGLGDIQGSEGVYGLQRAFKIAGAENLLMSLWKVPDFETAEFMQQFYKNLFAKQTIPDAFYTAQSAMKKKYRNDPFKWAAWVLIR